MIRIEAAQVGNVDVIRRLSAALALHHQPNAGFKIPREARGVEQRGEQPVGCHLLAQGLAVCGISADPPCDAHHVVRIIAHQFR